jgi:hypothetical protein
VYCIAYPLRRDGVKLAREQIRQGGRRGWLTFTRMPAGQPVWIARCTTTTGHSALPEMSSATVRRVQGGILITGFVRDARRSTTAVPQAWWCVPDPEPPDLPPPNALPADGRRGGQVREN